MGFWRKLARAYVDAKKEIDDAKKQVYRERQKEFEQEQLDDYNLFLILSKLDHTTGLQAAFYAGVSTGVNYVGRRVRETIR